MKKILLGSDKYGYQLKKSVEKHLKSSYDLEVVDVGCHSKDDDMPYYDAAVAVAKQISLDHDNQIRGILCCGTGMGMAIIANKLPGVYAAVCESIYASEKCRAVNNSNVLTMGEFITAPVLANSIVDSWMSTAFASGFDDSIKTLIETAAQEIKALEKDLFDKS